MRDVIFDTFATHSGLLYDVIITDCWAQNGSIIDRVFVNAKRRLLSL